MEISRDPARLPQCLLNRRLGGPQAGVDPVKGKNE